MSREEIGRAPKKCVGPHGKMRGLPKSAWAPGENHAEMSPREKITWTGKSCGPQIRGRRNHVGCRRIRGPPENRIWSREYQSRGPHLAWDLGEIPFGEIAWAEVVTGEIMNLSAWTLRKSRAPAGKSRLEKSRGPRGNPWGPGSPGPGNPRARPGAPRGPRGKPPGPPRESVGPTGNPA